MTVEELRIQCQNLLKPHSGIVPLDWITMNNVYYSAAKKLVDLVDLPHFRKQTTIALVASQSDYVLPVDEQSLMAIHVANNDGYGYQRLRHLPLEEAMERTSFDTVVWSYVGVEDNEASGDYGKLMIRLFPTPSEVGTLQVSYRRKPKKLTAYGAETLDIIEFPETLVEAIPYEMAWLWLGRNGASIAKFDFNQYHAYFVNEIERVRKTHAELFGRESSKQVEPAVYWRMTL